MPRVLLTGWDGADWRILDPLLERGDLPNLQALIDRGQRAVLRSTIPTHSWSAWPSFLTGVDPADHGVYDILENVPGTHKQYPVTYKSIRSRTFVEDLSAAGKKGVYADVPLMFPPPEIDGKVIAGRRIRATEWLMDNADWDFLMSVWVSVDRTQHALSNYVGPDHPDYPKNVNSPLAGKVRDVYKQLDDAIGSFVSRTRRDDIVIFMSDHGFQSCDRAIHMDHLLRRLGYLEFSASNVIFGPMQWGPVRKVARQVYDL